MRIVFFDLETGGIDPASSPITQIAAISVDEQLNEIESFECKVFFDVGRCDQAALSMNGYDEYIWKDKAISPLQATGQFSRFLSKYADIERKSAAGNPYRVAQLCGYNAATFDGPFIQNFFKSSRAFIPASYRIMDVYHRVIWYMHENDITLENLQLSTVAGHFGIEIAKAHDALSDVRTTIAVYKAMLLAEMAV